MLQQLKPRRRFSLQVPRRAAVAGEVHAATAGVARAGRWFPLAVAEVVPFKALAVQVPVTVRRCCWCCRWTWALRAAAARRPGPPTWGGMSPWMVMRYYSDPVVS